MVAYVPLYVDRWIGGTRVLSLEQRGAFADWIATYAARDGLFPDDINLFASTWGCNARKAKRLRAQLLAKGKLYSEGGLIHQTFAKECVSKAISKSEVSTNNAFKRWKNHRENNGNGHANAYASASESSMQTHMQSPGNHKEERILSYFGESQCDTPSTTSTTKAPTIAPHPKPATQVHPQARTTTPSPPPTADQSANSKPQATDANQNNSSPNPATTRPPSTNSDHPSPTSPPTTLAELNERMGWSPAGTRKPHP